VVSERPRGVTSTGQAKRGFARLVGWRYITQGSEGSYPAGAAWQVENPDYEYD
jgi:hypothetical protein